VGVCFGPAALGGATPREEKNTFDTKSGTRGVLKRTARRKKWAVSNNSTTVSTRGGDETGARELLGWKGEVLCRGGGGRTLRVNNKDKEGKVIGLRRRKSSRGGPNRGGSGTLGGGRRT